MLFSAVKWLTDRGSSELEQCALAAFIETGA
jgi:DNA-binding transcriptional MocR family regulator